MGEEAEAHRPDDMEAFAGCCSSRDGPRKPKLISGDPVDEETVRRLVAEGRLPVFAIPRFDLQGDNGIKQVFIAEYEGGVEITIIFEDEDRPNVFSDMLYDFIRRPLFGRSEDIESIFLNSTNAHPSSIDFPGTYADGATWKALAPFHGTATVPIASFEHRPHEGWANDLPGPVVWVNTWSHLFGEANANPEMEMVFCSAAHAASAPGEPTVQHAYPVYHGSRADVDSKFHGLVSSFAKTMSAEKLVQIGKRKTSSVVEVDMKTEGRV